MVEHRWQEAVELIDGFSDEDLVWYFNSLTYSGMRDDLFELLEKAAKFASEKVRQRVAQGMLTNHERYGGILTEDQNDYLQRFVEPKEE